jgi:hypothetical protein
MIVYLDGMPSVCSHRSLDFIVRAHVDGIDQLAAQRRYSDDAHVSPLRGSFSFVQLVPVGLRPRLHAVAAARRF